MSEIKSNKWCSAGEIECGEKEYCDQCFGLHLLYFDQCPWPSCQQPIEKENWIPPCNKCGKQHLAPTDDCPYDNTKRPITPAQNCQHLNAGDVESEAAEIPTLKPGEMCPERNGCTWDCRSCERAVAAEISTMPDAEFKANCEKLKKLKGRKNSKKLDELIKPHLMVGKNGEMTDSQIMYNHGFTYGFVNGCHAQAVADREAVKSQSPCGSLPVNQNTKEFRESFLLLSPELNLYENILAALSAAEIREA